MSDKYVYIFIKIDEGYIIQHRSPICSVKVASDKFQVLLLLHVHLGKRGKFFNRMKSNHIASPPLRQGLLGNGLEEAHQ